MNTITGFAHLLFLLGSGKSTAVIETALHDETFAIVFNVQKLSLYYQPNTSVKINSLSKACFSTDSRKICRCSQRSV